MWVTVFVFLYCCFSIEGMGEEEQGEKMDSVQVNKLTEIETEEWKSEVKLKKWKEKMKEKKKEKWKWKVEKRSEYWISKGQREEII